MVCGPTGSLELRMHVWDCFFETQTKKRRKSRWAISYPGKLGTRLKCLGANSQGPTLNFIFRWLGTSAICIFGTHRMSFLFLCAYRPVSTDSSNVHEFKNKIHFVTDFPTAYTKNVGLHLPGNIPFTFTEFFIVSTALTNVPFGIWERRTLHCPDQDIILRTTICKFSLHLLFLIDGTNLHPVTPLPTKRNNKQNKNK